MSGTLKLAGYILTSVPALACNHVFDKNGKHLFDQSIIMEQDPRTGKLHTRAWLIIDNPDKAPTKNEVTGQWEIYWYDQDKRVHRKITSKVFHESWDMKDAEREDRKTWPEEWRRALPGIIKEETNDAP